MSEVIQQEQEKATPHKIGWGERTFYGVSVLLWIAYTVALFLIFSYTEIDKDVIALGASEKEIEDLILFKSMLVSNKKLFFLGGLFFTASSWFIYWFIYLSLGSWFLKKAIIKKGIASPYQGSRRVLLLRSDLINLFFVSFSNLLILLWAFTAGANMLLSLGIASTVGGLIGLIAWYPSLRYILNKEGIYRPGLIKTYVWMWFKGLGLFFLALLVVALFIPGPVKTKTEQSLPTQKHEG